MKRPRVILIKSPEQWSAVASPIRYEIVEVMRDVAPCGIAEIARRMGFRPDSLYRHVEILREAGYVVTKGFRKASRGSEQLFDLTADDFMIDFDTGSAPGPANDMIRDTAKIILKRIGRVIQRTAAARAFNTTQSGRNTVLIGDYARLTPAQYKEMTTLLRRVKELLDAAHHPGESGKSNDSESSRLYSVLLAAIPVVGKSASVKAIRKSKPP